MHLVSKRRLAAAITCLLPLAATLLPAHHVAARPAHSALRIGLVLDIGGRNDKSFNQLAYQGALLAQKEYGITFSYVQSSAQTNDIYFNNLAGFARKKYDLIIGVGFIMAQAMLKAALAFPNIRFAL